MKASRLYGEEVPYAFLLLFLFLLAASLLNAQPVSQTFNSSGTYTVPTGYSANVTIQAWGAGAGGGSGAAERGGGGGGAYASVTTILPAGSYAVTVGTGGTVGNAGGNSSFTSFVIAEGGRSTTTVTGGLGGTTAASTGTTKFAGGAGGSAATTGGAKGGGGGGGSATSLANGGVGGNGCANACGNVGGAGGIGNGTGGRGADGAGTPDAAGGSAVGGGGGGRGSAGGVSKPGNNGQVIVSVNSVLPVKLGNIKAYEKQNGIQIDWTAYSEENVSHYQVERSANGASFNAVGEVLSRNSVAETKYGFFDSNPLQKVSFYRLKNIDLDGKSAYSNIVKINLDKSVKGITMYPNPVTANFFSLQSSDLAKGNYSVKVFTAAGQEVYGQKFTHNGGAINQTFSLPNGTNTGLYSLVLKNDATQVMSKIFIVQ